MKKAALKRFIWLIFVIVQEAVDLFVAHQNIVVAIEIYNFWPQMLKFVERLYHV
jgi:hypothetical protein